jgi:hypothetical protein
MLPSAVAPLDMAGTVRLDVYGPVPDQVQPLRPLMLQSSEPQSRVLGGMVTVMARDIVAASRKHTFAGRAHVAPVVVASIYAWSDCAGAVITELMENAPVATISVVHATVTFATSYATVTPEMTGAASQFL